MKLATNFFIGSLLATAWGCQQSTQSHEDLAVSSDQTETVIALGSCYDGSRGNSAIFEAVVKNKPDMWIWLGDIVYGDTHDMTELKSIYDSLKQNTYYKQLREQVDIIGVWDDHDYGQNDGGKFYSRKKQSKEVLLDFLDVPSEDKIHDHEGAYSSYILNEGKKKVKILLLDARYFRDTVFSSNDNYNRYGINEDGDVLGDQQWNWLEQELLKNEADVHLIGSGYQIIPTEHPYEKWANFPKARLRLFNVIERTQPNLAVLMSGDRHMSELASIDLDSLAYPLYEFTSSGLTHTWDTDNPEPNKYRVGEKVVKEAFGVMRINWADSLPEIVVEVRGVNDTLYSSMNLKFQSK